MKSIRKLGLILIIFTLTFAPLYGVKAQQLTENMKTFFDSEIPGIKIQVNATAKAQPSGNITVVLSMKRLTDVDVVDVEYFNLSIYGFVRGEEKTLMKNITDYDFALSETPRHYNFTFIVPEQVWEATHGEITMTYSVKSGPFGLVVDGLACGFTMTLVRNVYLENLENAFENLNNSYWQLHDSYEQLNQTYWELQQNYTALRGNLNELGNTRTAVGILAVTTVFFVATTLYLVMRKPKESW
jgi:hypothetical protein